MSHDHSNWEYLSIPVDTPSRLVDQLNLLGAEGWELVSVIGDATILKRPRPGLREIVTADQRKHVFGRYAPEAEEQNR